MRRLAGGLFALVVLAAGCSGDPAGQDPTTAAKLANTQPSASSAAASTRSFTVAASGDVLIHPALTDQATEDGAGERDYRPLLAGVKPVISGADLAICHLEVPLADKGGPFRGYPSFSAPPEVADALLDTGYDSCSTASNHTLDQGEKGITRTLDKLDEVGIKHTGSARTEQEAETPLVLDVHGVKVGQVSFTFGFNGIERPAGKPWVANQLDAQDVISAAKAARAAGAQVVIASLHWGTEYQHEVTAEQKRIAQQVLADPAVDLIIGHHAHVVQPFDKVNGKWVAYGLGNHVAKHEEPRGTTEEGVIARFRFTQDAKGGWSVDQAEYFPTLIDLGPPIRLVLPAEGGGSRQDKALSRTEQVVLSRDADEQGLTRGKP
ncbi:CapA family protein [Goodfellowiella coeruleoviolacea]|uniref:Poly-gamma-glutamate synthesis protein (Capsule biosynthesis protein) n=1 Tax=Goodfellowiella coeruleoviolacea TaxID=334858 RepID=A0AAE3GCS8_9PSEU|nr:CapA family protein [Goodfellowiella coeruleoviolacea]MCP2164877.1 poly-gamma-glutamate synthesis protein (capsule biosynthesis protein) [Goodfellowiella coeruleoviolacea]